MFAFFSEIFASRNEKEKYPCWTFNEVTCNVKEQLECDGDKDREKQKKTKTRNVRRNELENYCVSSLTANDCETGTSADFSFLLFLKNTRQMFVFLFTRAFFHLSSLMFSWKSHSQMENEIIQNDSYNRPFENYTKMVYVLKSVF